LIFGIIDLFDELFHPDILFNPFFLGETANEDINTIPETGVDIITCEFNTVTLLTPVPIVHSEGAPHSRY